MYCHPHPDDVFHWSLPVALKYFLRTQGLYKGKPITILYKPHNPFGELSSDELHFLYSWARIGSSIS
jgi:hypothetical protein